MKKLSDFRHSEWEGYVNNGMYFPTVQEFLTDTVGFCNCGDPEEALVYLLKGLQHVESKASRHTQETLELFGNASSEWFFYYWLDSQGFVEHGCALPGWLTETGQQLKALLEEWKEAYEPKQ